MWRRSALTARTTWARMASSFSSASTSTSKAERLHLEYWVEFAAADSAAVQQTITSDIFGGKSTGTHFQRAPGWWWHAYDVKGKALALDKNIVHGQPIPFDPTYDELDAMADEEVREANWVTLWADDRWLLKRIVEQSAVRPQRAHREVERNQRGIFGQPYKEDQEQAWMTPSLDSLKPTQK